MAFRTVLAIVVTLTLTSCSSNHGNRESIALPNPKLLGCTSDCSQLWQDGVPDTNAKRPTKVSIDFSGNSPSGIVAVYDKSVSVDDLRQAINARYGQWAHPSSGGSPVLLWRVEPDKYAIQVSANGDGTSQVIFMTFR